MSENQIDPVTKIIKVNMEKLGINPEAFDLLHDCLWDIIMKKPVSNDNGLNKLDGSISKIKLHVVPEDNRSAEEIQVDFEAGKKAAYLNPKAFIRIRIPRIKKEKEDRKIRPNILDDKDSEGDKEDVAPVPAPPAPVAQSDKAEPDAGADGDKEGSKRSESQVHLAPLPEESLYEEVEYEDRVTVINPNGADFRIWGSHEAPSRILRKEIIVALKKTQKEFEDLEIDELVEKVEDHSVHFEKEFLEVVKSASIPVFDFEIN